MDAWFAEATERFAEVMQRADPVLRQQLYDELGIAIYSTPGHDSVEVTIQPRRATGSCRRGDLNPEHTAVLRGELVLNLDRSLSRLVLVRPA